MLEKMGEQVKEFHDEITGAETPVAPRLLPLDRVAFRVSFIEEELDELKTAINEGAHEEQVDALIDIIYVAIGTLAEMGSLPRLHFDEVHLRNMEKERGTKATRPGSDGFDAIKPAGWQPPDHAKILAQLELQASVSPGMLEATRIRKQRTLQYNNGNTRLVDHFPLGLVSYFQMMWVKIQRIKSQIESGVNDPKVLKDSCHDLMNYADFTCEHIKKQEESDEPIR